LTLHIFGNHHYNTNTTQQFLIDTTHFWSSILQYKHTTTHPNWYYTLLVINTTPQTHHNTS